MSSGDPKHAFSVNSSFDWMRSKLVGCLHSPSRSSHVDPAGRWRFRIRSSSPSRRLFNHWPTRPTHHYELCPYDMRSAIHS